MIAGLVDYPFPLADGQLAHFLLPLDLDAEEAERIIAFIRSLVTRDEAE